MTKNRFLFSQILLFAIVGMGAALLVWAVMIWPAYGIWHPRGGISQAAGSDGILLEAGSLWRLKFLTILPQGQLPTFKDYINLL